MFTCISVSGNAILLSGDTTLQYQMSTGGAIKIKPIGANVYGSAKIGAEISKLIQKSDGANALGNVYNAVTKRAIDAEGAVALALSKTPVSSSLPGRNDRLTINGTSVDFPNDGLGRQLQMVARLIKGRSDLVGVGGRQVFFVSIGGFDLHDNLITQHPGVLGSVSAAISKFYEATALMGDAAKVTTFTASDFGRTLASNGNGSDHGWGSHHFVVGGAVNGQKFYGTPPPVSVGDSQVGGVFASEDQWHVGQGRLLPTTSVDQYVGTMAKWFGVEDAELPTILPNIVNFDGLAVNGLTYPKNMGFMKG